MSFDNTAPDEISVASLSFDNTAPTAKTLANLAFTDTPNGFGTSDYFAGGVLHQNVAGVVHDYDISASSAISSNLITATLTADLSPFHTSGHTYEIETADGELYACTMSNAGTAGAPYTFVLTGFKLSAKAIALS